MAFGHSSEQLAFSDAVGRRLDDFDADLDPRTDDAEQREAMWRVLDDDLGLMTLPIAEEYGGAGGTWKDVAVAIERLAERPAVGGLPAAYAGIAALVAIDAAGTAQGDIVIPTWLFSDRVWAPSADGRIAPGGLLAERSFVGDDAPLLVAPSSRGVRALVPVRVGGRIELWLTARDQASELESVDPGAAILEISNAPLRAEPVYCADPTLAMVRARASANALIAIEAVGSSAKLLQRTIDYLKIRTQFGQVLASFQGLQFMAADLFRQIEPLRSIAYTAVDALERDDVDAMDQACAAAKIAADALHPFAALEAIQMHGAIGFSWELGLHRHFKRAVINRSVGGNAPRRLLADRIRDRRTCLTSRRADRPDDALRREVRDWIARNCEAAPVVLGAVEPMHYERTEAEERWIDLLREGRWLCLSWPVEYGGRGLSALECIAVNEEFAAAGVPRLSMGIGETLVAPAILAHGTDEQKARLLPRILSGADRYCQAFSEPDHGSDLARLQTRGEVGDDGIRVTGTKIWQSAAQLANRVFLLCRTDPDASPHAGLTYCIADIPDNGITIEPIRMMPGFYGYNQTNFDNAFVSYDDVIGGINNGWKVAITTLGSERAGEITTQYLGHLRELDHLIETLAEQGKLDAAVDDLVELWIEVLKMKVNGLRVVEELRDGKTADGLMGIDKINWSEYHVRFGLEAARMTGLRGLVRPIGAELPHLQQVMLESPGRRISRGTNQIQRRIIAQRILGMPR